MLDSSKVQGQDWRVALSALLLVFVGCLAACAMRALAVTGRAFRFHGPGPQRIDDRAAMNETQALVHRAAELLRSSEVADQIGRVKIGLLRSAAWWFRIAILTLAALAALILAYAISGPHPAAGGPASTTKRTTTAMQTSAWGPYVSTPSSSSARDKARRMPAPHARRATDGSTTGPIQNDESPV